MTTVLITAFGHFPGAPVNPTGPLARALVKSTRRELRGVRLVVHEFPTSYAAVARQWPALIARHRPDVVLMLGLAANTSYVRIETLARNARSIRFPDVDGYTPPQCAIDPAAPLARRGRAPFLRLLTAARATGTSTRLSADAGDYLCNDLYWRAMHAVPRRPLVQFVHIPLRRNSLRAVEAVLVELVAVARRR